ncbi:hypothetical protein HK101_007512 [Irineochytrium annulatum]|nr:hypothetical protein HK101_007512 [Irineochytrium annulatum]
MRKSNSEMNGVEPHQVDALLDLGADALLTSTAPSTDHDRAIAAWEEAVSLALEARDGYRGARALLNLAVAWRMVGRAGDAIGFADRAWWLAIGILDSCTPPAPRGGMHEDISDDRTEVDDILDPQRSSDEDVLDDREVTRRISLKKAVDRLLAGCTKAADAKRQAGAQDDGSLHEGNMQASMNSSRKAMKLLGLPNGSVPGVKRGGNGSSVDDILAAGKAAKLLGLIDEGSPYRPQDNR